MLNKARNNSKKMYKMKYGRATRENMTVSFIHYRHLNSYDACAYYPLCDD